MPCVVDTDGLMVDLPFPGWRLKRSGLHGEDGGRVGRRGWEQAVALM